MIRILKNIFLVIFVILLLAQLPFVYRRYQFAQLQQKIAEQNTQRAPNTAAQYKDFTGVIHVHSSLGGHSLGQFDELVTAAKSNALDFVVMTEHPSENFDTSAATLSGTQSGVLFINGNEVGTASEDRFLLLPGSERAFADGFVKTPEFLRDEKARGKLAFITYPEKFKSWDADYDGIEVFSLHTNAKKMNPAFFALDAFWSYSAAPEIVLANYFQRPDDALKKFDELAQRRKLTLFSGTDAHSNIGVGLGVETGDKLLGLKFDPYASIFRLVRTHVLLRPGEPLTQDSLLRALKNGNCYIGFNALGNPAGFSFTASNGAETKIMGDELAAPDPAGAAGAAGNVTLSVKSPLRATILILHDGAVVHSAADQTEVSLTVQDKGAYRVEAYLDALGAPFDKTPWIVSNPVYVR